MSTTKLADINNVVQDFWSDLFMPELLESALLASLVNRDYQGDIKQGGDTVKVSQINRIDGEIRTVGVDADVFNPQKMTTSQVDIVADKRISASVEFEDLVMLQSQLGQKDSEIRQSLIESANIQLNNYLYSLVAPIAAAPDHTLTGVTDFNASQVSTIRKLAAQAKWAKERGGWWLLADPQYYSDMLNDSTLTSSDYVPDAPIVGGQMAMKRFGFNILEDNSAGLVSLSSSSEDAAIAFHPDFMALVMQQQPRFKLSDLHANKQYGFVLSVDFVFGAKQLTGVEGDKKVISIINS
jgi:hypothetical protein